MISRASRLRRSLCLDLIGLCKSFQVLFFIISIKFTEIPLGKTMGLNFLNWQSKLCWTDIPIRRFRGLTNWI